MGGGGSDGGPASGIDGTAFWGTAPHPPSDTTRMAVNPSFLSRSNLVPFPAPKSLLGDPEREKSQAMCPPIFSSETEVAQKTCAAPIAVA